MIGNRPQDHLPSRHAGVFRQELNKPGTEWRRPTASAGRPPDTDRPPLTPAARHARAVEIRQQVSELAGTLADTASGQQPLYASPGTTRRTRPAEARILHRMITELTMLATATTVMKRRARDGAPQTSPLFGEAGLSAANDG
jgi:hypothetical protein